jgi:hypothetical protein
MASTQKGRLAAGTAGFGHTCATGLAGGLGGTLIAPNSEGGEYPSNVPASTVGAGHIPALLPVPEKMLAALLTIPTDVFINGHSHITSFDP